MKIAKPFMTVWLLSCALTFSPGFAGANRNLNSENESNQSYQNSELERQAEDQNDLASFKVESLNLIIAEKKKRGKTTTTSTLERVNGTVPRICNHDISEPTTMTCAFTRTKKSGSNKQNSKTHYNNNDGKWKKIQKFFFGPPTWPFSKNSYRFMHTTSGTRNEHLRPKQIEPDETTIIVRTYLHPIPNEIGKDEKILVKEEIIRNKAPNIGNIYKGGSIDTKVLDYTPCYKQITETETLPMKQQMYELPSKQQPNRIEPVQQIDVQERIPSKEIMDQQDGILSREWIIKQERVPADSIEVERIPSKHQVPDISNQPSREMTNILEHMPTKEQVGQQDKEYLKEVILKEENIPPKEYNHSKDMYYSTNDMNNMETLEPMKTVGVDGHFSEPIITKQLNNDINKTLKENVGISIQEGEAKQSFKQETSMEVEQTGNNTNLYKPSAQYKQDIGVNTNKRQLKNMTKANEIMQKQLNDYFSSEKKPSTYGYVDLNIENNSFSDLYRKYGIRDINEYQRKMAYESQNLFNAFSQFLKTFSPEIINKKGIERQLKNRLSSINKVFNTDSSNLLKAKQFPSLNTQHTPPLLQYQNIHNGAWQNTASYPSASLLDNSLIFRGPTNNYLQVTEYYKSNKENKDKIELEGLLFKRETSSPTKEQFNITMWPRKEEYTSTNFVNRFDLSDNFQKKNEIYYPFYHRNDNFSTSTTENRPGQENKIFYSSYSSKVPNIDNGLQKQHYLFDTMVTIPTLFSQSHLEATKFFPLTVTIPFLMQTEQHYNFNNTSNPLFSNNLWGMKKIEYQPPVNISSSFPAFTTMETINDDSISFENQHEYNTNHHFSSTTLDSLMGYTNNPVPKEWSPLNIPVFHNQFNNQEHSSMFNEAIDPNAHSGEYLGNPYINHADEFLKITGLLNFNQDVDRTGKSEPSDVTSLHGVVHNSELVKKSIFQHPLKKPASRSKSYEFISRKIEPIMDLGSRKILGSNKIMKDREFLFEESLNKFERQKSLHENSEPFNYKNRIPQVINENNQPLFPPSNKKLVDKNTYDSTNFIDKLFFLKNANKYLLTTQGTYELNEKVGFRDKGITQIGETDMINNDNKFDKNIWGNKNIEPNTLGEENNEETKKYEHLKADMEEDLNLMSTLEKLQEFQSSERPMNIDYSKPHVQNNLWSDKPRVEFNVDEKSATVSNNKYNHNSQNEKLLAKESSYDKIMSSPKPELFPENVINNTSINENSNLFKQSIPGELNSFDPNKNEFSAVQMSLVKIVHKNPELLSSHMYMPLKKILTKSQNSTEISEDMLSHLLLKMHNLIHKLVTDSNIKKRMLPQNINVKYELPNKRSISITGKTLLQTPDINNSDETFQYEIPTKNVVGRNLIYDKENETPQNCVKALALNDKLEIGKVMNDVGKFSDEGKYDMQTLIDGQNDKRFEHYDIYDEEAQGDSNKILSYDVNNNLQQIEILRKPLEGLSNQDIPQANSNAMQEKGINVFSWNSTSKRKRSNVLGNKKMKSRELEFILEKNLPGLPLNKGQFITYMMTGMKKSRIPITSEEERRSHLSKINIQNLIDRNAKKDKMVAESSNKRPRKKQWQS